MANTVYSDLHPDLLLTPLKHISIIVNDAAIAASIQNILLTYPSERLMRPEFGCRVMDYLFESNIDEDTYVFLEMEIREAITQWEPRVTVSKVEVGADPNEDRRVVVSVFFTVLQTGEEGEAEFQLYKEGSV